MTLEDFDSIESIYIDANIFLYVILRNPQYELSCKTFLERIERGEINGVISPLIIDEVAYKIIVEKLKSTLDVRSNVEILRRLSCNPSLLNVAKPDLLTFLFVIQNYQGMSIKSVLSSTGIRLIENVVNRDLLPRDALHLAILEYHNIKNIATRDDHFDTVSDLNVFKPSLLK